MPPGAAGRRMLHQLQEDNPMDLIALAHVVAASVREGAVISPEEVGRPRQQFLKAALLPLCPGAGVRRMGSLYLDSECERATRVTLGTCVRFAVDAMASAEGTLQSLGIFCPVSRAGDAAGAVSRRTRSQTGPVLLAETALTPQLTAEHIARHLRQAMLLCWDGLAGRPSLACVTGAGLSNVLLGPQPVGFVFVDEYQRRASLSDAAVVDRLPCSELRVLAVRGEAAEYFAELLDDGVVGARLIAAVHDCRSGFTYVFIARSHIITP